MNYKKQKIMFNKKRVPMWNPQLKRWQIALIYDYGNVSVLRCRYDA
jgi:hypothetical protein